MTLRQMMITILASGILLGWVVGWEGLRGQRQKARAQQIMAEAANDPFRESSSPQEALKDAVEASRRARVSARMWSEGPPSLHVIAFGAIVDLGVMGLALAIGKAIRGGNRGP